MGTVSLTIACLAMTLKGPGAALKEDGPPAISREFRGVWVATVDNIDWPSKRTLGTETQKAELVHLLDKAKALGLNAVILQVRPSADALYPSKLEPWSEYLTGLQGRAPSPFYDPLKFAVQEAHHRGLELHCWFNPYRAVHFVQKGPVAATHIAKTNPEVVKSYGKYQWMDPSEPLVQKRTLDVMMDVVRRYDVDGIHIDDYFYPYKEKDSSGKDIDFPDSRSWNRYVKAGGKMTKGDWRRENVNSLIKTVYTQIKKEKRWVKFGISPFGIYRPGVPNGIKAGVDQYADLYADAQLWLVEGWCDYFTPQLYWPIKRTAQSYPKLLEYWLSQNYQGRHLWPGNYTSQTDPKEAGWKASEVLDQIQITRDQNAGGNVHFSMVAFLKNWAGINEALHGGPYREPALVPASPWLDDVAPRAPKVKFRTASDLSVHLTLKANRDRDIRFFAVSVLRDSVWQPVSVSDMSELELQPGASKVSVVAIDRTGNASPATVVNLR